MCWLQSPDDKSIRYMVDLNKINIPETLWIDNSLIIQYKCILFAIHSIWFLCITAHLLLVHLTDFGVAQAAYTLHGDNISKWYKTFKKAQVGCSDKAVNLMQIISRVVSKIWPLLGQNVKAQIRCKGEIEKIWGEPSYLTIFLGAPCALTGDSPDNVSDDI